MPRRVVVCSIARGTLEGTDGAAQRGRVPLVARLLEEVTTANAHTTWLLLRVLLDEQVKHDLDAVCNRGADCCTPTAVPSMFRATDANNALLWMQVVTAALARGMTLQRAHEAGAGAYAQAQTGMNSISEAEKTFTSQVSELIEAHTVMAILSEAAADKYRCSPCLLALITM